MIEAEIGFDNLFYAVLFWDLSINLWGCSSAGRALEWHSRGRRFDPVQLHHFIFYSELLQSTAQRENGRIDRPTVRSPSARPVNLLNFLCLILYMS